MVFFIRHFLVICLILGALLWPAQSIGHTGKGGPPAGSNEELMISSGPLSLLCTPPGGFALTGLPELQPEFPSSFPPKYDLEWHNGHDAAEWFILTPVSNLHSGTLMSKRKLRSPWLAVSAIPFAAGGVAAHLKTLALHREYRQSVQTDEAVKLQKEVKHMQVIRNVTFGVAGLLGVTGILLYKKQDRGNKKVRIEYLPFALGGSISLTF